MKYTTDERNRYLIPYHHHSLETKLIARTFSFMYEDCDFVFNRFGKQNYWFVEENDLNSLKRFVEQGFVRI